MKSERRHELATNELADWIANFPQWYRENQTTVIVGVVVVVALIAYTIFYYKRETTVWNQKNAQATALLDQLSVLKQTVVQGRTKGVSASDMFLNTASALQTASTETDNSTLAAMTMIKRAEALRSELHYRPQVAEQDVRNYQLQQAQKEYEKALEKAGSNPQIAAMAEYGRGLCLEDMGDYEAARAAYEKISKQPEYKGTVYPARAEIRLQTMGDNSGKVVLAKSEVPEMPQTSEIQAPGALTIDGPVADINKIAAPEAVK